MKILGDALLPVAALVVIIFVMILMSKKKQNGSHYDEMQLKIRGDGYKLGFFVTLAGTVILLFLTELFEGFSKVVAPTFGMFVVIMTGIVSFVVYCIFKEAFLSIGQNVKSYMVLCAAVILANVAGSVRQITQGTFLVDGALTFSNTSNLVCAISFLVILIALIIKTGQDRKEVGE